MRHVYKVLAYLVAVEVAVQAAMVVWGDAGLGVWIAEGGVLDKSFAESGETPFPELIAFVVHAMNGMFVIPAFALILLIVSFWVKVPGAVKAAALVVVLVAAQITFGILGHSIPLVGAVHGINALLLFSAALYAARRPAAVPAPAPVVVDPQPATRI